MFVRGRVVDGDSEEFFASESVGRVTAAATPAPNSCANFLREMLIQYYAPIIPSPRSYFLRV